MREKRRPCARLALALVLVLAVAIAPIGVRAAEAPQPARDHAEDFDAMWRAIDAGYAYFGADGRTAWRDARAAWRPRAVKARTAREFLAALEGALATLHDGHVSLSRRTPDSPRRIPSETDIWAHWEGSDARIDAVRTFGDADVAGLHPGDTVLRVQGEDVEAAVRARTGTDAAPGARDRALRELLAGPRFGALRLDVRDERGTRSLAIARAAPSPANGAPIAAHRVGDERDIGYLRLKPASADAGIVEHLDAALGDLADTRGLIIDLRESAGPASRAATRAILARFAPAGAPWQLRESRNGRRVTDTVPDGARPYPGRLVVLVDRWTEGEAEALAAGLGQAAHARLVGTATAGLRGNLRRVTLPHSRIVLRFPAERTFLLDGTPREALRPDIAVDLAAPSGGPGDPILYQALKAFEPPRTPAR